MSKILIIDDDEENIRFMLGEMLRALDHDVVEAEDGYEGIDMAREESPDLIITDISMPQMDGVETTKRIRGDDSLKHIPIFVSTGEANAKGLFNNEDLTSVQGFISKPYEIAVLAEKIKTILTN